MSEMELYQFEVGKQFPIDKVVKHFKGSQGGGSLDYHSDEKMLSLYLGIPKPNSKEIREFRNGVIRFALYPNEMLDTSLILIQFGQKDFIFDLVFDINTLDIDIDGKVEGNRFNIYLIDSDTGILKGMRVIGLGKGFMKELNKITHNDKRYTSEEYTAWVKDTYQYNLATLWSMSKRVDWDR